MDSLGQEAEQSEMAEWDLEEEKEGLGDECRYRLQNDLCWFRFQIILWKVFGAVPPGQKKVSQWKPCNVLCRPMKAAYSRCSVCFVDSQCGHEGGQSGGPVQASGDRNQPFIQSSSIKVLLHASAPASLSPSPKYMALLFNNEWSKHFRYWWRWCNCLLSVDLWAVVNMVMKRKWNE